MPSMSGGFDSPCLSLGDLKSKDGIQTKHFSRSIPSLFPFPVDAVNAGWGRQEGGRQGSRDTRGQGREGAAGGIYI